MKADCITEELHVATEKVRRELQGPRSHMLDMLEHAVVDMHQELHSPLLEDCQVLQYPKLT